MGIIIKDQDIFKQSGFDSSVSVRLNDELKRLLSNETFNESTGFIGKTAFKSAQMFKECSIGIALAKECLLNQTTIAHPLFWEQHSSIKVECEIDYLHSSFVTMITLTTATTQQTFERLCFSAGHVAKAVLSASVAKKTACLIIGISRTIESFFFLLIDSKDNRWSTIAGELVITLNKISKNEIESCNQ